MEETDVRGADEFMVKGLTRRVVIVDAPDPDLFEQAIFIVRNEVFSKEGVTQEQVIAQARQVAKGYTKGGKGKNAGPGSLLCTALGAGGMGLVWLLVSVLV